MLGENLRFFTSDFLITALVGLLLVVIYGVYEFFNKIARDKHALLEKEKKDKRVLLEEEEENKRVWLVEEEENNRLLLEEEKENKLLLFEAEMEYERALFEAEMGYKADMFEAENEYNNDQFEAEIENSDANIIANKFKAMMDCKRALFAAEMNLKSRLASLYMKTERDRDIDRVKELSNEVAVMKEQRRRECLQQLSQVHVPLTAFQIKEIELDVARETARQCICLSRFEPAADTDLFHLNEVYSLVHSNPGLIQAENHAAELIQAENHAA
jgi:hypothetical protein